MARPRPRSTSNTSLANNTANTRSRPPTTSPQLKRTYVQASDSIYQNNITVLRRREPTILAILDFFSHVCLYHYTEKGWEKRGFEGTMFLVEHQDFPPYGIYILNRMGTGDFSRRIYPEDDLQETKQFVLYRYYPDYTQKRIELHLPYPLPPEFRPTFDKEFEIDHSQIQQSTQQNPAREKKGNSVTLGLWTYPTPSRESLATVMTRLHKFVKAGERYPDEFRYGPGRPPPPPNNRPRSGSQSSVASGAQPGDNQASPNKPTNPGTSQPENASGVGGGGGAISAPSQPNSAGSEVDKLFAKLQPQLPTDNTPPSSQPPSASSSTSQGWISALNNAAQPSVSAVTGSTSSPAPTGLSLLNSIFASVQPSESASSSTGPSGLNALSSMPTEPSFYPYQPPQPSHAIYQSQMQMIPPQMTTPYLSQTMYPQTYNNQTGFTLPLDQGYGPSPGNPHGRYLPPHPEEITIVSPKPTSSALPQILNQEVIAGLLGLSPEASSRASSVAPSVSSEHGSRDFENDRDERQSESGRSGRGGGEQREREREVNNVSRASQHVDPAILEASVSTASTFGGLGQGQGQTRPDLLQSASSSSSLPSTQSPARVQSQGDATPRMPARPMGSVSPPSLLQRSGSQQRLSALNGAISRNATVKAVPPTGTEAIMETLLTVRPTDRQRHAQAQIQAQTQPQSESPFKPEPTQPRARNLIPFEADSELWPYPRAPVDERSPDMALGVADAEVLELDFSDTRALSDPVAFTHSLQQIRQHHQQQPNKSIQEQLMGQLQQMSGSGNRSNGNSGDGTGNGNGKKKSRRERATERQKEREAIENGWDDPSSGKVNPVVVDLVTRPGAPIAIEVPPPAPPALPQASSSTQRNQTENQNQSQIPAVGGSTVVNGSGSGSGRRGNRKGGIDPEELGPMLMRAVEESQRRPARDISRKQFVQEVLGLIYSDTAFVDRLWSEYTGQQPA